MRDGNKAGAPSASQMLRPLLQLPHLAAAAGVCALPGRCRCAAPAAVAAPCEAASVATAIAAASEDPPTAPATAAGAAAAAAAASLPAVRCSVSGPAACASAPSSAAGQPPTGGLPAAGGLGQPPPTAASQPGGGWCAPGSLPAAPPLCCRRCRRGSGGRSSGCVAEALLSDGRRNSLVQPATAISQAMVVCWCRLDAHPGPAAPREVPKTHTNIPLPPSRRTPPVSGFGTGAGSLAVS